MWCDCVWIDWRDQHVAAARRRDDEPRRWVGGESRQDAEGASQVPGRQLEAAAWSARECRAEGRPGGAHHHSGEALFERTAWVHLASRPQRETGAGTATQGGTTEGIIKSFQQIYSVLTFHYAVAIPHAHPATINHFLRVIAYSCKRRRSPPFRRSSSWPNKNWRSLPRCPRWRSSWRRAWRRWRRWETRYAVQAHLYTFLIIIIIINV